MRMTDGMISRMELDKSFVPPFPDRPQERAPLRQMLRMARRNVLSIFTERDYLNRQMRVRIFGRELMICNNPGGVRESLGDNPEAFAPRRFGYGGILGLMSAPALVRGERPPERQALLSELCDPGGPLGALRAARECAVARCGRWQAAGQGATLDMVAEMGGLATDFSARILFGEAMARRHGPALAADVALYERTLKAVDLLKPRATANMSARKTVAAARQAAARARARVATMVDEIAREGDGDGPTSLVAALLAGTDAEGRPLPREAVCEDALALFAEGRETMALTLAWALYLVSQSERVRASLAREFETVLDGTPPRRDNLPGLTYTRAVIEETMRLYPPVPMLVHTVTRAATVNGVRLKRGALFVPTPWLVHRNRAVWSLPDHFVPERFDAAHSPLRDAFSFLPFRPGEDGYPVAALALNAMTAMLATLFLRFDIDLAPGHEVMLDARYYLRPGVHLPMRVTSRRPRPLKDGDAGAPVQNLAGLTHAILAGYRPAAAAAPATQSAPADGAVAAALAIIKPDAPAGDIARAHAAAEARAIADYRRLPQLRAASRLAREGTEHRDAALDSGRSIVLAMLSTATSDLAAAALTLDFGDALMVLSPAPAGVPPDEVAAMRRTLRLPVIPAGTVATEVLAARIRTRGTVLALPLDLPRPGGEVPFPFFGRAAPLSGVVPRLLSVARESDALVVPVTLVREGRGHRLTYHPPRDPAALGTMPLVRLNETFEPFVRAHLASWRPLAGLAPSVVSQADPVLSPTVIRTS